MFEIFERAENDGKADPRQVTDQQGYRYASARAATVPGLAEADRRSSVLCIDGHDLGAKREFMKNALQLWNRPELPPLHLKAPWHGYEFGYWCDRNREEAELARRRKALRNRRAGEERRNDVGLTQCRVRRIVAS
jgi:hypothetical protein